VSDTLARAAYSLLLRLATPLYLARLWWRGRSEALYRHAPGERLGLGLGLKRGDAQDGRLWLHAVSLGETRAAAALVDALRHQRPGLRLLLTHGTATGREAGRALLREGDTQAWLPYDTPGAVRRFLRAQRPQLGVVMETEIWPNLMRAAREAQVPMVLANARLSKRSQRKGQRLAALMHPALAGFARVLAQTEGDAQRLRDSGAREVLVMGNLKYDMTPSPALLEQGRAWRRALLRAVVLATSTREGEEDALLRAWCDVPSPRPLLLLVPRHPQRFDEVATLVQRAGLHAVRRSAWADVPPNDAAGADVWLGDSMGEMPLYYACADVALLGGSFAPLGGQNLIEAAACGCPLVMGPHTFNFAEAAELSLQAGASLRARDIGHGVQLALQLVQPSAQDATAKSPRDAMASQAQAFAAQHRGAAARMAQAVVALLPE
jgi:3-deoxy-D-manno-octulosonic-acid transferase